MAGLSFLQTYDTDSETDSDEENDIVITTNKTLSDPKKISEDKVTKKPPAKKRKTMKTVTNSVIDTQLTVQPPDIGDKVIFLPPVINSMFLNNREVDNVHDDPGLHEGRIRSFVHEKNNWASYVYIDCQDCDLDMARNLISSDLELETIDSCHLSVSRVVSLRHHWIQPLVESLKCQLNQEKIFHLSLDKLQVYVNDERTRTFVGLEATGGCKQLSSITEKVNKCFNEFSLPPFYHPPSFHCSLGWCLGDQRSRIQPKLQNIQLKLVDLLEDDEDIGQLTVKEVTVKTGNKLFQFTLK